MKNTDTQVSVSLCYPLRKGGWHMIESRCGITCSTCTYKEQTGCLGCVNIKQPFWGECPLKSCCETKGHDHCGLCEEFPCALLTQFSYDEKQGDQGKRIANCKLWLDL